MVALIRLAEGCRSVICAVFWLRELGITAEMVMLEGLFGVNGSEEDGDGENWRSSARTTKAGVPLVDAVFR